MAASCLPVLLAATVNSVGWLFPLWVAGGVVNGALNVMGAVIVADRVRAEARGRAYGLMNAVVQTANMLGFLAAGPLIDRFGARELVAACGALGLLAALACLPMMRLQPPRDPAPGGTEPVRASVEA
jgi:predicted MFS family arabinose efflux permease